MILGQQRISLWHCLSRKQTLDHSEQSSRLQLEGASKQVGAPTTHRLEDIDVMRVPLGALLAIIGGQAGMY